MSRNASVASASVVAQETTEADQRKAPPIGRGLKSQPPVEHP